MMQMKVRQQCIRKTDEKIDTYGLCLANPCRVALVGGVGASKTTTLLNCIARCAEWKPFEHFYLMGPSHCVEDMQKGEYNLLDVTTLIKCFNYTL